MSMLTKICSDCAEQKPRSSFFPSKATDDGLHTVCMPCAKAGWKALSAERDARMAAFATTQPKKPTRRRRAANPHLETSP